jgi:hypothetical protein
MSHHAPSAVQSAQCIWVVQEHERATSEAMMCGIMGKRAEARELRVYGRSTNKYARRVSSCVRRT